MWTAQWETVRLWLVTTGLRVVLVLALAWIAARAVKIGTRRIRDHVQQRHADLETSKRADTLAGIVHAGGLIVIAVVTGLVVLSLLGVNLGPILAMAGIGGLAVGFGAQNLVRDVISGFFILLEDQVRVGDVVQLNGQGGLVEAVTLRHIRLRDLSGTVHYFPNGTIDRVANMTKQFSFYLVDMGVAYRSDPDEVMEVMRRVLEEMRGEEPWRESITEPLEVLGVDRFADSAIVVRARIKTIPLKQWAVGREYNRRLKKAFDAAGIEIPFPQRVVTFAGKGPEAPGRD